MLARMPLALKIVIGLLTGVSIGVLLRQVISPVNTIADGFVMLLQMTALPYISLSLITSIGGLKQESTTKAIQYTTFYACILLVVVIAFILLTPLAFPDWKNAAFYSLSTIKASEPVSLLSQFISPNPFYAYANAIIPAVVVFSLFIGVGLMQLPSKRATLVVLNNLLQSVANVNSLIMKWSPIGVAFIGWRAGATLNSEQLDGLTVLLFSAMFVAFLLCFAVIPSLIAAFTPFGYRKILKASRSAMITGFATGSFFAVIPVLVEKTRALVVEHKSQPSIQHQVPALLIPITFSLPVGGKLLALLFVLFSAWFSGAHIDLSHYVNLISLGLPQLFGSPTIAIKHLLELFNVSYSMFDLYLLADNLFLNRLSALMSVMFAISLSLFVVAALNKQIKLQVKRFVQNACLMILATVLCFYGIKQGFESMSHQYQGYEKFIDRDFMYQQPKTFYKLSPETEFSNLDRNLSVLERVKRRGLIRVGYFRDDLPYAFHNKQGKLVGFDIELLNLLALDLNVDIEFVRIFHNQAKPLLSSGYLDMTTGIPLIPDNLAHFTLTEDYSKQYIAFLVKNERREEFTDWNKVKANNELIIGIPETFFYKRAIENFFKEQKAWQISTPRLFFKEKYQHIDAMLFGAAASSGWTLLYPDYTVIAPKPTLPPLLMAFPINKNDHAFYRFMANWIAMKKQSQTIDTLFSYWIEGNKSSNKTNEK